MLGESGHVLLPRPLLALAWLQAISFTKVKPHLLGTDVRN
jgi:hypothetical protein